MLRPGTWGIRKEAENKGRRDVDPARWASEGQGLCVCQTSPRELGFPGQATGWTQDDRSQCAQGPGERGSGMTRLRIQVQSGATEQRAQSSGGPMGAAVLQSTPHERPEVEEQNPQPQHFGRRPRAVPAPRLSQAD